MLPSQPAQEMRWGGPRATKAALGWLRDGATRVAVCLGVLVPAGSMAPEG